MIPILDRYVLKKYLLTFLTLLLLFIPIGITVNLAEKIGRILENEVPLIEVLIYYYHFTIYFANLLFPLFLFLSVIWFTSKMASNTEIVAVLSSGVSYMRFLRPYLIGATIVCIGAFFLSMYMAPKASKGFNEFVYTYLKKGNAGKDMKDVHRQINDNDYIYVSNFSPKSRTGTFFTLEHFEDNELKYKISAKRIRYNEKDSTYTLYDYIKREIGKETDLIKSQQQLDSVFAFEMEDLMPEEYIAETLDIFELNRFIERETERGSSYINRYNVVWHKRWSIPASAYILTIIAVAVASRKRRGGMGVNLAIGITIGMVYIFFDKIFGTMAEQSDFSPFIATWFPNIVFGIVAIYLLYANRR